MRRYVHSRPVVGGLVVLGLGLAAAVDASLAAAAGSGGVGFELGLGIGYALVGALLLLGTRWALWLNAGVFCAALGWALLAAEPGPYALFVFLARLAVPMLVSWYLMMPWVWRRLGHHTPAAARWTRVAASLGNFTAGGASIAVLLAAAGYVVAAPTPGSPPAARPAATFAAQFGVVPSRWQPYGQAAGDNPDALPAQITPDNVATLEPAWRYRSAAVRRAWVGGGWFSGNTAVIGPAGPRGYSRLRGGLQPNPGTSAAPGVIAAAYTHPIGVKHGLRPLARVARRPTRNLNPDTGAATPTGVVFVADTFDGQIRAVDLTTGELLWHDQLRIGPAAQPTIHRRRDGCQYVTINARGTRGHEGHYIIAYALPECRR